MRTTDQVIRRINERIDQIEKHNKPLELAVRSVMAMQSDRIFVKGENSNNAPIGEYSNRPVYVSPSKSPKKFAPKGKSGEAKFGNGKPHKTGYFENYLSFKKSIGRNKGTTGVDLVLSGELAKDFSNASVDNLKGATATKINANFYQVSIRGNNFAKTVRYGNVFKLTAFEKESFFKVFKFELLKILRNA